MGERGHDVDNCPILKYKVQHLIDKKILNFQEPEPNVHQNPLPEHNTVNMIKDKEIVIESDDEDVYEVKIRASRLGDAFFDKKALLKGEIVYNLGEDSEKYNFQVKYTPPP